MPLFTQIVVIFYLQQFAFKPTTNNNIKPFAGLRPATLVVIGLINNIKPFAGLRPATLVVMGLINNCCKFKLIYEDLKGVYTIPKILAIDSDRCSLKVR